MKTFLLPFCAFLIAVSLFAAEKGNGAETKKEYSPADFMRTTTPEGKKQPVSFDTAIAKFTDKKSGVEVDLISAVHVGDKDYYEYLNKIFKKYDAVLYELVAAEEDLPGQKNDKIKKRTGKMGDKKTGNGQTKAAEEGSSALSAFQSGMGKALSLDFQLDIIDYYAKNMIHADLSPQEFAKRAAARGDLLLMLYRSIMISAKQTSDSAMMEKELKMQGRLLGSLFSSDPSLSMKRLMAKQITDQTDEWLGIIGSESAIITDRNAAALRVLRREIAGGKKKIAVFYGGAHLPNLAECLEKDFDMEYVKTDWVVAWDLTKNKSARQ
ncbi:MAG: hypothetical protein LBH00_08860 [Planctomycetaceae bacterium]|jgi:hypothetical protein|nr:hypothetical protein [Planctomycetaceae bacterium]